MWTTNSADFLTKEFDIIAETFWFTVNDQYFK